MTTMDILSLPGWLVQDVHREADHLLIEADVEEMPFACPWCGSCQPPYRFGHRPIQIADLPIRMCPVTIVARRRRYRCRDCGKTFLDQLKSVHAQHEATERLVSYVQVQALHLTQTFTGLAGALGVSEWLIRDIFAAHVAALERAYVVQTPRYLGSDEIYVEDAVYCVLTDLERHAVVDLLPRRDMSTVKNWLRQSIDPTILQAACMDHWNPYRTSFREVLPRVKVVVDHFHVVRQVNEIVEDVRKSLREELNLEQRRQLKQDHRILQKRARDLTPQQRLIVESWTGFVPVLKELLRLKEAFYGIYDAKEKQEAYKRYMTWEASIPPALYEAFLPLLLTIEEWGAETFAFWELPTALTNAFTERVNLSIRQATRAAFGLNYRTLRAKLLFCPSNVARLRAPSPAFQPQEAPAQS
jgi:transposase